MNNEQLEELVIQLDLVAHDLSKENKTASDCVALASKTIAEAHLVIQLLKAKVDLLEYQPPSLLNCDHVDQVVAHHTPTKRLIESMAEYKERTAINANGNTTFEIEN